MEQGGFTMQFLAMSAVGFRPADLPRPGAVALWTLERPLPGAAALVVAGLVVFLWFNRAGKARRGLTIGGAAAMAGVGLFVIGSLVTTARERVLRATQEIVAAASVGDAVALEWLLAEGVALSVDGRTSAAIGEASLVEGAVGAVESGLVEGHSLLVNEAVVDGPGVARSRVHVRSDGERGPLGFTWWTLYWRRDADGEWRVTRLDWIALNGRPPAEAIVLEIERAAGT